MAAYLEQTDCQGRAPAGGPPGGGPSPWWERRAPAVSGVRKLRRRSYLRLVGAPAYRSGRPMRRALLTLSLALAAAVGTRAWADGVTDSANCAVCHSTEVGLAAREGGHAPLLDCATCHEDRRPGSVGHGHRSIPTSCTAHHETVIETHPPPARKLRP